MDKTTPNDKDAIDLKHILPEKVPLDVADGNLKRENNDLQEVKGHQQLKGHAPEVNKNGHSQSQEENYIQKGKETNKENNRSVFS